MYLATEPMLPKKRGVHQPTLFRERRFSRHFTQRHVGHGLHEHVRILANPVSRIRATTTVGQVVPGDRTDASEEARRDNQPTLFLERHWPRHVTHRHVGHGLRGFDIGCATFSGIGGLVGVVLRRCVNSRAVLVRRKPVDGTMPAIATRAPWARSTNRCCVPSTSRSART